MDVKNIQKPILSISLLSSGREKTIWKCLDSLKPLQEAISTELIIVDTGCDEEIHEAMKNYTEKIIKFDWCNDFSKARNIGLKEAKGEWFLYIDDDEWFTDVKEIIDFFTTGEYKNYGVATYIQRNYLDKNGKIYRDSWVSRMIKLDQNTKFMSSIHEFLYPIKGKCKMLHSPVDHFGYVFENNKEKYSHSKRNISLLEEKLEEEKEVIRWWIQLAQEYMGIEEFLKVEELCKKGIEYFKNINQAKINASRGTFYIGLIKIEIKRNDYKKAEENYLCALKDKRNTDACRARIYSLGAEIYYKLGEYENSKECCIEYIKIYEQLYDKEFEIMVQSSFFVGDFIEEEIRNNVYGFYIGSTLKAGDTSILKYYFNRFGWEKPHLFMFNTTPADIIVGMASLPFEEEFIDFASTMIKRRGVNEKVIQTIQKIEKTTKDSTLYIKEGFKRLCRIFSEVESNDYYIIYMKICYYGDVKNDRDKLKDLYEILFQRVINIWELEDTVFSLATKFNINMESIFLKIKFENWKKGVDILFKNPDKDKIQLRMEFLYFVQKTSNIRYDYFYMKESEAELRILDEDESYESLEPKIKKFCNKYLKFYHRFYKEEAFQGEMEMLPPACRLALKLSKVFEEEEKGNIRAMAEALKECFGIYPAFDKAIKIVADTKKEEVKEAGEMRKELLSLGEQVKLKIYELTEQGLYAEALPVLQQLKALLPKDSEIITLESTIKEGLS